VHKQILINTKLHIRKRGQKTELTWRSPFRRQSFALERGDVIEEEEEDEENEDEDEKAN